MRRRHSMPFGAEVLPAGGVRFRLWAPSARTVTLCLEHEQLHGELAVPGVGEGWFELVTARARPGSRYRYRIDEGLLVPDPASRFNPTDVHGPSEVIDGAAFEWQDEAWRGRPWQEAVIYELHVGAFSAEGSFAAVARRLDYLVDLGVTAIELMPVADFPGARDWGYDGALAFAPDSRYGRPEDFKRLVQAAHQRGLMVFLDVVYNHFGPEGNYLHTYAAPFFTERHHTPWGAAINYDGADSAPVREFFIHNALYWLEEFHLDGLRLDAVHAIRDDSDPDILVAIAEAVRAGPGRQRQVHLVLENDNNAARYLRRDAAGACLYTAQWNDDLHHCLHLLLTGETDGYYADYALHPVQHLARCLAEGFAYQGEVSFFRQSVPRGEPSRELPPGAFVAFLQNHDQVGNRAFGERITALAPPAAVRAAVALLLLAPAPPLLFMGEEFAAARPFLFFCDFGGELAQAVTDGRRAEFARFPRFRDAAARSRIPDANAIDTFRHSCLDWTCLEAEPHRGWRSFYRELLALRRREIVPRLAGTSSAGAVSDMLGAHALRVRWTLGDGAGLSLVANLGPQAAAGEPGTGALLHATPADSAAALAAGTLPPWSVVWFLAGAQP